jgi:hypothetical protein
MVCNNDKFTILLGKHDSVCSAREMLAVFKKKKKKKKKPDEPDGSQYDPI